MPKPGYYVEVRRPPGEKAADFAQLPSFEKAIEWLLDKQATDPALLLRLFTCQPVLSEDHQTLRRVNGHLAEN